MTTSSPFSADRPRETRSASIDRTTVLFSVAPSHSPTGSLRPSAVIARATITHRPAMCSPSSISTLMSCSDRSRDSSSASAVSVSFTNRRETADRPVERAPSSTSVPSGSAIRACRRVATPASIRSSTTCPSRSSAANWAYLSSGTSCPSTVRARGLLTSTRRPPRVTDPFPVPCRTATRSGLWRPLGPVTAGDPAPDLPRHTPLPPAPPLPPRGLGAPWGPGRGGALGPKHRLPPRHTRGDTHRQQPLPDHAGYIGQRETDLLRQAADAHGLVLSHDLHIARYGLHSGPLFWSGRLGGRPTPTARQASGGGPPPQVPRRPGQPRCALPSPVSSACAS